jgi:hypothetical protein
MNPAEAYEVARKVVPAFRQFYMPMEDGKGAALLEVNLPTLPGDFSHLAESFRKNLLAVVSTASMPFRIVSTNHSHWVYHQLLLAEKIRTLAPAFDEKSEEEKSEIAHNIARQKFDTAMKDQRRDRVQTILADLEHLLIAPEMVSAAAELIRQSETLAWGTLEVLANDLFISLLNRKPQLTEDLIRDERTKKRFPVRDMSDALTTYGYDLSRHMGDVLNRLVKIDDIETLRAIYQVLMPNNAELQDLLADGNLWKLNQRRNLILHRRSMVDETYLKNTGENAPLGTELLISPEELETDLLLVLRIGSSMLQFLSTFSDSGISA